MAKLENFYFKEFTKVNEAVHPQSLKDSELQQLNNMRLDSDIASAVARKGFSRYNEQVDTSGTINSIFDVKDSDGNNYLLSQIGTKLRKSLNGTGAYSDIKTGLTSAKMRMIEYGEKFIFTNDNEEPFYSDLTNTYDVAIERPDMSDVEAAYTVGAIWAAGTFHRYILVYVTDEGQYSNPSHEFQIYNTAGLSQIVLSSLPVSSDARVTKKILYRTDGETLSVYYQLAILDNSDTTFTDVTPYEDLVVSQPITYMNTPLTAKYITSNSERIFFGNITKTLTNIVIPPARIGGAGISSTVNGTTIAPGYYKWGASYVDSLGNESEMIIWAEGTIAVTADQVNLRLFPLPNVTADLFRSDVSFIRIYRTKVGGSTFYHQGDIDINSSIYQGVVPAFATNYVDIVADASLGDEYPLADKYSATVSNLKATVVFSNISQYLEYPEVNLIQVYPDENDEITGIFNDDNGVVVFKERSICKIYTNGDPTNWSVSKMVENIGCDAPNSIYKYGNSYFFGFENRIYLLSGNGAKNISESLRDTWDTVTEVTGATFWNDGQFYVASVKVGSGYKILAYDTKLDGWYNWTVNKADSIIVRLFGTDKGKILVGGNTYVVLYNEDQDYDSDTGTRVDITVNLKTKDFIVDGFVNMRLMTLYIDYRKLLNRNTDSALFMLTDPTKITSNIKTYNDNSSTVVINKFKMPTDAMVGNLKRARVINFTFNGYSIDKFINARLDYLPEFWGVERRSPGVSQGLGISHGSEAGVSD